MSSVARGIARGVLVLAVVAFVAAGQEDTAPLAETSPPVWEFPTSADNDGPAVDSDPATSVPEGEQSPEEDPLFGESMRRLYSEPEPGSAQDGATDSGEDARGITDAVWQAALSLCVVLGIILLLSYGLRRYASRTPLLMGQQLGRVLGRVNLGPKVTLHYVRTGGRVLVVGVSQNSIAPVAEFDEEAFAEFLGDTPEQTSSAEPRSDFLEALSAASGTQAGATSDDDELTQLRSDLQRLRHYLRDSGRERDQ